MYEVAEITAWLVALCAKVWLIVGLYNDNKGARCTLLCDPDCEWAPDWRLDDAGVYCIDAYGERLDFRGSAFEVARPYVQVS